MGGSKTFRLKRLLSHVRTQPRKAGTWQVWVPVLAAVVSAAASAGSALWAASITREAANKANDAKMIEIGVAILAADPGKTDVAPAREWAIGLIEEHSVKKFTSEEHEKLLHQPIVYCDPKTTGSLDFSNPCNSALIGGL